MKESIRAVAIILQNSNVLLMWRKNHGKEYYVFPGGGVEKNETVKQAVLREVMEETSLKVTLGKLLYHHMYDDNSEQFFYLCSYLSGTLELGDFNEKKAMKDDASDQYCPQWIAIDRLKELCIYPLEIKDWLIEDIKTNFRNTPREATINIVQLREE